MKKIAEHFAVSLTSALKDNEDIIEPLSDRIEGRMSLHDVLHPVTEEILVTAGEEISAETAKKN